MQKNKIVPNFNGKSNARFSYIDPAPAWFIRQFRCLIINVSLHTSYFPQKYKHAIVFPFLKKDSLNLIELKKYRPINQRVTPGRHAQGLSRIPCPVTSWCDGVDVVGGSSKRRPSRHAGRGSSPTKRWLPERERDYWASQCPSQAARSGHGNPTTTRCASYQPKAAPSWLGSSVAGSLPSNGQRPRHTDWDEW